MINLYLTISNIIIIRTNPPVVQRVLETPFTPILTIVMRPKEPSTAAALPNPNLLTSNISLIIARGWGRQAPLPDDSPQFISGVQKPISVATSKGGMLLTSETLIFVSKHLIQVSIQHDPVVMGVIPEVVPVGEVNKGVMDSDNGDIIHFSNGIIGHSVVLLETVQSVVVVVPKNGLVEELNDGHGVSPF